MQRRQPRQVLFVRFVKPKVELPEWEMTREYRACVHEFSSGKFAIYKDNVMGQGYGTGYRLYPSMEALEQDFEVTRESTSIPSTNVPSQSEQRA